MDPGAFDEAQYRAALLRKMRASEVVVHAARFAPRSVSAEPALVAATSSGKIHVFLLQKAMVRSCVVQCEMTPHSVGLMRVAVAKPSSLMDVCRSRSTGSGSNATSKGLKQ